MAIELYPHNEYAYQAARLVLWKTGKAAIIHPTGTGKSFIGFKFCEDFLERKTFAGFHRPSTYSRHNWITSPQTAERCRRILHS